MNFWFLAVANLLLTMSVYSLLPVLPTWMSESPLMLSAENTGIGVGVFGLGVFALGCFCSFLVQRYRRNMVCMACIAAVAACSAFLYYVEHEAVNVGFWAFVALRFVHGACYGLAKMVLVSTLVIDSSVSARRTVAGYISTWFARFALSLGPLLGVVCATATTPRTAIVCGAPFAAAAVFLASTLCAVAALVLVAIVRFPFRTPEEGVSLVSLDRFFLPRGLALTVNLMLVSAAAGLLFSISLSSDYYAFVMLGFLLAVLSRRFVFVNADLKSEAVCGMALLLASFVPMLIVGVTNIDKLSPTLFGLGVGITSSRFMLFFVKLSGHCQRGTLQSTYFLGWEIGLYIGLTVGLAVLYTDTAAKLITAIVITAIALAMYVAYTHTWYMRNKNR